MTSNNEFQESNDRLGTRHAYPNRTDYSIMFFIVFAVLMYAVFANWNHVFVRTSGRARSLCKNNMKQIGLALHNYHDKYGSFPPAYTVDDDGRPMHSWRVLLLPQLDEQARYEQFRLDEPWDSPHNLHVASVVPKVFRCPQDELAAENQTSYVAIGGEETIWPGSETVTFDDVTDGTSNTIAVVEVDQSLIGWTEPRDLSYEKLEPLITTDGKAVLASAHRGGAHVLMVDGSVRFIAEVIEGDLLRRLIERNDGQPVGNF